MYLATCLQRKLYAHKSAAFYFSVAIVVVGNVGVVWETGTTNRAWRKWRKSGRANIKVSHIVTWTSKKCRVPASVVSS